MITVDMRDRKPIYEQLIDNIRTLAVQGILQPDEHLPSVRQLAAELAINPNTIQKAYQELERQHVIYSLPGRGNFISGDIRGITEQEQRRVGELLRTQLQAAKKAGLTREALITLIDDVYHHAQNVEKEE
ncbi:MAG: GntR family transcriptional regulator [Clostridia bacterium]|nr:GntR family transcriptional regulator [Clostridia bacterium]